VCVYCKGLAQINYFDFYDAFLSERFYFEVPFCKCYLSSKKKLVGGSYVDVEDVWTPEQIHWVLNNKNDLDFRQMTKDFNELFHKNLSTTFKDSSHSAIGKKLKDLKRNFETNWFKISNVLKRNDMTRSQLNALLANQKYVKLK